VSTFCALLDVVKPFENLDFALVESLLLGLVLILEFLDCYGLASGHMAASIDVPEAAPSDQFFLLILVVNYHLGSLGGAHAVGVSRRLVEGRLLSMRLHVALPLHLEVVRARAVGVLVGSVGVITFF